MRCWTEFIIVMLGLAVTAIPTHGELHLGTVYLDEAGARFASGKLDKTGAAYGTFNVSLFDNGWNVLNIKAGYGQVIKDTEMAYAAGYLEGVLTASEIWSHYQNMRAFFLHGKDPVIEKKIRNFFDEQDSWTRKQISARNLDPYWRHVSYIMAQIDGLYAGYKAVAKTSWDSDVFVVRLLNAVGDLLDLVKALHPPERPNFSHMSLNEVRQHVRLNGMCSALVKVTGAYENLFMAHSSWFSYSATLRIYKHYDFNFRDEKTASTKLSFSSYPGFLESLDDFYIMSNNLVLLQTTNNVFNTSLYELVKPDTLFAWQRVRIANFMANSGREWANLVSMYNSGTYNNQYMVIDLSKITLKKEIQDDALWVVEQIPGLVAAGDETAILRTGYWPSYNVPFFETIYNRSGYPEFVEKYGLDFSYQLAPRAKIFRRDQNNVHDFESMKAIMRYNDYLHDNYSEGNPCNTICCRGDLSSTPDVAPRAMGCYDSKVADYKMVFGRESYAINGPSLSHGLPPFSWTGQFANMSHVGLPEKYTFPWVHMIPSL